MPGDCSPLADHCCRACLAAHPDNWTVHPCPLPMMGARLAGRHLARCGLRSASLTRSRMAQG